VKLRDLAIAIGVRALSNLCEELVDGFLGFSRGC